jgi:hypothetical protein
MCSWFCRTVLALVTLLGLTSGVAGQGKGGAAPEATVSIAAKADLEAALAAIQRASRGVVLAEIPEVDRRLPTEMRDTPLSAALAQVSRAYHLYWRRRGSSLVLLKRYADPREITSLEREELAAVTRDIARLLRPFAPFPSGSLDSDQREFVASISPAQARAMQEGGLPFLALRPEQQALWLKINTMNGYSRAMEQADRLNRFWPAWNEGVLTSESGGEFGAMFLWYPDPTVAGGRTGFASSLLPGLTGPSTVAPRGEITATQPARRPAGYEKTVRLPGGETTLAELARAVEAGTGAKLRVPAYAEGRQLLAVGERVKASDVVTALEDLYGWKLTAGRDGQHSLGRPGVLPARDALDLHARIRAVIPPSVRLMWDEEGSAQVMGRVGQHWAQTADAVTRRKKARWDRASLKELDSATARRLANAIFDQTLGVLMGPRLSEQPLLCLAAPERGYFLLSGSLGPGRHPLLRFKVDRPGPREDSWGWFVGTSSLEGF